MRLIDADKLKECYTGKNSLGTNENDSKADYASIRKMIDSQPTAYDVDNVVEQLGGIRKDENIRFADQVVSRAVNIVKGGLEE